METWIPVRDLFSKVRARLRGGLEQDKVMITFKELAPRANPIFFNKKTKELLVDVPNSALAQNLYFRNYQIIEEINRKIGHKALQRIRFRIRDKA